MKLKINKINTLHSVFFRRKSPRNTGHENSTPLTGIQISPYNTAKFRDDSAMKICDEISRLFWISRSFLAKIEFKSVSFFAMKRGKWVI